jgi:hypothetical protein
VDQAHMLCPIHRLSRTRALNPALRLTFVVVAA